MTLEDRTIHEISLLWPGAVPVLEARGIDTCCGGMHSLREAVAAHGQVLTEVIEELQAAGADPGAAPVVVDVRDVAPRDRHPLTFSTFDGLPDGGVLNLVNDHDPKPLFYEMQAERAGQVVWEPLEEGPERWLIRITRTALDG